MRASATLVTLQVLYVALLFACPPTLAFSSPKVPSRTPTVPSFSPNACDSALFAASAATTPSFQDTGRLLTRLSLSRPLNLAAALPRTLGDKIRTATGVRSSVRSKLDKARTKAKTLARAAKVSAMALPAAALYPLAQRNRRRGTERAERFFNKWLDLAMRTAERGGPVIVKLCQWASSRPDIFGTDFCDTFKRLQDDTKPHSWEYTERFLEEAYGGDWMDHLKVDKNTILGSGCMAQVYKAVITNDDGSEQPVAVKVMHPNVRKTIAKDLRILRYLARTAENLPFGYGDKLKWNNLAGNMEDFAEMLVPQLDLRKEANHIERFNKNFASTPSVVFPKLVPGYEPNENVLVETFCEGTPIDQWCREHADDVELRSQLGYIGAETMCRMIFEHNFVHGDVHPGNILISPDNEMILLDCGMVNEYSDTDHDLLINIIAAFIRLNGRRAGELMVDDSNQRMAEQGEYAREVDLYLDEMEKISSAANKSGFLLEKVSTYVNFIFNSAAKHHVQMNSGFVSIALAIKVQEGVALMLDDKAQIIGIANPIIMKAEAKRMNQGGFERILRIAKDTFRDVKVRWERESDARRLAAQGTAENSR